MILCGNPMWEKTTTIIVYVFLFDYKEKFHYILYWRRLLLARRHPPIECYNLHLFSSTHRKGATTPLYHLMDLTRREHLTLNIFTSYHWKEALIPLLKAPTLNTLHGPCFIIFQTGSTRIKTSKLVGHLSTHFHTRTTSNIKPNTK